MFYTKPVGKFVLSVCRTLSCALNGAERVTEALCEKLAIKPGQTDPTGTFTVIEVECLGACDRAPVMMVNDDWHERLSPEQAGKFIGSVAKTCGGGGGGRPNLAQAGGRDGAALDGALAQACSDLGRALNN